MKYDPSLATGQFIKLLLLRRRMLGSTTLCRRSKKLAERSWNELGMERKVLDSFSL
jgi:hypothetical protein